MKQSPFLAALLLLTWQFPSPTRAEPAVADNPPAHDLPLLDASADGIEKRLKPTFGAEDQVSAARSQDSAAPGVVVTIQPGNAGYPGVDLKPVGAEIWDLSGFGHVEARIANTGAKAITVALRVDNAGDWHDSPWNTEQVFIKPGASATVRVIFGYSYNHQPGYALKPGAVANIELFTTKSAVPVTFRIESIVAGGPAGEKPPKPPADPKSVRVKPKDGVLFNATTAIDPPKQIEAKGGAQAAMSGEGLKLSLPTAKGEQSVSLKPAAGRWDLTEAMEIRVKVKNAGQTALTPAVQAFSDGSGATDLAAAEAPLPPGAEREIAVSFAPAIPAKGIPVTKPGYFSPAPGTGTRFCSDAVSSIKISARHEGDASLLVESIRVNTPVAEVPDWVGRRPPADGEWVKTFDDEFDGSKIDEKKWNIYGPNYWDKRTHWSKDNLVLGGGVVKERFEKKTGFQNDDPTQKQTDYACGFLETYGKWVQRYGYFEARVKLPSAPGLWPTFWLMPDRGVAAGPQWKRQDTGNGGMEFDIMEHLSRWGTHRYNIAMHWDGYGKKHASLGDTCNYVLPDKDGFITCGLLWTPGSAVYYCNGKELFHWDDPRISNVPSNIILETTPGGWENNALDDAQLPADYVIDYIRCWQRKDLASDVDGFKSPASSPSKDLTTPHQ